jgi:hypothetical protein
VHFLEDSFHFITHLDSKFFRTWWLIMTRPAVVSTDIAKGIITMPLYFIVIGAYCTRSSAGSIRKRDSEPF